MAPTQNSPERRYFENRVYLILPDPLSSLEGTTLLYFTSRKHDVTDPQAIPLGQFASREEALNFAEQHNKELDEQNKEVERTTEALCTAFALLIRMGVSARVASDESTVEPIATYSFYAHKGPRVCLPQIKRYSSLQERLQGHIGIRTLTVGPEHHEVKLLEEVARVFEILRNDAGYMGDEG